jgi:hypothetical protein
MMTAVVALSAGNSFAAETPPYGHKDFVPTPERPVSSRNNNALCPGPR